MELSARGSAVITVSLMMMLLSAVAVGAAVVVQVEVRLAERFRQSSEALYAAQAVLDVAVSELRELPDWTPVTTGMQVSRYSEGAFTGSKRVPGGGTLVLCCGVGSAFDRVAAETRLAVVPGRRALAWRPFLWTAFDTLVPRTPSSGLYVIVLVADDPDDGLVEGDGETNGIVLIRAEAIDPGGLRRSVESLVLRVPAGAAAPGGVASPLPAGTSVAGIAVLAWREVR